MSSVPCRISSFGSWVDILPETITSRVECQGERYCCGLWSWLNKIVSVGVVEPVVFRSISDYLVVFRFCWPAARAAHGSTCSRKIRVEESSVLALTATQVLAHFGYEPFGF